MNPMIRFLVLCLILFGNPVFFTSASGEDDIPTRLEPPYVTDIFYGQFTVPEFPQVSRPNDILLDPLIHDSKLHLTMEDAVRLVVRNNLNVQLQRYTHLDSQQGFFQSEAIFEPLWNQSFSTFRDTQPSPSLFTGVGSSVTKETAYSTGLSKFFSTGTTVTADLSIKRFATNNEFYMVNPSYDSVWTVSLTQQLLKGFGRDVNRSPVLIAKNTLQMSQAEFQMQLEQTLLEVSQLYWDILYFKMNRMVKQQFLELSEKTRDDVAVHVDVGTQPELNLYKAKTTVAGRQAELIEAENNLKNALQLMVTYISPNVGLDRELPFILELDDMDPLIAEDPLPWKESIQIALTNRPEIKAAQAGLSISLINMKVARNSLKPSLNLTAGYTQYGMKGTIPDLSDFPFPIPPDTEELLRAAFSGGAWDSLVNSFSGKYNGFNVQVDLTIPVGNLDARAQAQRAAIDVEKQKTSIEQIQQQISLELRTIYNNLARDRAVIQSAIEARRQAEKNLDGEQARYDAGIVVIRDLLEAQRKLSQARTAENFSKIHYRKTLLEYYKASSQLLKKHNIKFESALKGETSD